jgi:hypothetical protein
VLTQHVWYNNDTSLLKDPEHSGDVVI